MLIILLIFFLVSNAVTLRRDKSILISRLAISALISLLIFLLVSNAVTLRRDKSIFFSILTDIPAQVFNIITNEIFLFLVLPLLLLGITSLGFIIILVSRKSDSYFITRFITNLTNKLTLKFILNTAGSFLFAVLFTYFIQWYCEIIPLIGWLTIADLSFFGGLGMFSFSLSAIIEHYTLKAPMLPMGNMDDINNKAISSVNNGTSNSSQTTNTANPTVTSSSNSSQTTNTANPTGTSSSNSSQNTNTIDAGSLNSDMHATLKQLLKMNTQLGEIKRLNNVKLILEKEGSLSIDAPLSISDSKISEITKRVAIADRIYNTQLEHYQALLSVDKDKNREEFGTVFNNDYKRIVKRHNDLFDKD